MRIARRDGMRAAIAVLGVILTCSIEGYANAEEPPPIPSPVPQPVPQAAQGHSAPSEVKSEGADDQELERVVRLLKHLASQSRAYRTWAGLSALAIGGAAIPAGVVMLKQGNNPYAGFLALGGGIGSTLGGGLLLALPFGSLSAFERLSDFAEEQRATGKSASEILSRLELEWQGRAESERSLRRVAGILGVGFGTLLVAGGTYLAVGDASGPDFSRKEQYGFAAGALGLGFFEVIFGLQAFFFEKPLEAAWNAYATHKGAALSSLRLDRVTYTQVPGGATIGLGVTF